MSQKQIKNKNEPEEMLEDEVRESRETGNDFFSNSDSDFTSFMAHMKTPKKEVSPPPGLEDDDEPRDAAAEQVSEEAKEELLQYMDFSQAHYKNAQFWLIQIDKVMALTASFISGLPAQKYRQRLEKPTGEDYEAEILAALIKKYQMTLSLEGMFITAMVLAYGPVLYDANQDGQRIRKQRQQEAQNEQRRQANEMPRINPDKSRRG